ncbi:MAG: hypothetical protein ACTHLX_06465 [Candidatus Binatia bacterium]
MAEKKTRILLACDYNAYKRIFAILSGYELVYVAILADAKAALKADGFSLVLTGIYFDQGRIFEVLKDVKSDVKYANVPIACFRGSVLPGAKFQFDREYFESRCKAMGANEFFDLMEFADDATGNAAIRNAIVALLTNATA